MSATSISKQELHDVLSGENAITLIDVREVDEFSTGHIETAINIPLSGLADAMFSYPNDAKMVFVCQSGKRSMQATNFAQSIGYSNARSLEGGMNVWR